MPAEERRSDAVVQPVDAVADVVQVRPGETIPIFQGLQGLEG